MDGDFLGSPAKKRMDADYLRVKIGTPKRGGTVKAVHFDGLVGASAADFERNVDDLARFIKRRIGEEQAARKQQAKARRRSSLG